METDEIVETPTEPVVETPEVAEDVVVEETPTPSPEGEVVETPEGEETTEPETPEVAPDADDHIKFDATEDLSEILTKGTELVEKYELPVEIASYIDVLKAKAEAPSDSFTEYAEYGEPESIKMLLDRQSLLDSVRVADTGETRPDTDKFVATLDSTKADWLHHDLSMSPSDKYPGILRWEETIADALAIEGDTVGSVMARYRDTIEAIKSGADIKGSAPSFIPVSLQKAYWSIPKEERDEIDTYHPDNDRIEVSEDGKVFTNLDKPIRDRKLALLAQIQKGIEGDEFQSRQEIQTKESRQQTFNVGVQTLQNNFYDAIRSSFTEELAKTVTFSTDPKMQSLLTAQNVALLTTAFSPDSDGEFARKALIDAGIPFDGNKAAQLMKDVETASVALEQAKMITDASGNPINQVELAKAKAKFERAGKDWQLFSKTIRDQMATLTSTGTTAAVDKAADAKIEKKKLEIKARPSTKGTSQPVSQQKSVEPPSSVAYGTPAWDKWWAQQTINEREARKAQAYQ